MLFILQQVFNFLLKFIIYFIKVEMKKLYDILLDSFKNKDFSLLPGFIYKKKIY